MFRGRVKGAVQRKANGKRKVFQKGRDATTDGGVPCGSEGVVGGTGDWQGRSWNRKNSQYIDLGRIGARI